MKLRNKKTGKVIDSNKAQIMIIAPNEIPIAYLSIGSLNEEWEDYNPAEPLIKDEKVRTAVRAWAEAEGAEEVAVMCHLVWGEKMTEIAKISNAKQEITFKGDLGIKMGNYTITELCGREE